MCPFAFGLPATVLGAWLMPPTYIFGAAYIYIIYLYFINSWNYSTTDKWIVLLVSFWFLPCVLRLLLVSFFRVSAFTLSENLWCLPSVLLPCLVSFLCFSEWWHQLPKIMSLASANYSHPKCETHKKEYWHLGK